MPNLQLGNLLTAGNALLAFPNKYSFNFDGSNDYLEAGESSSLGTGTNFTISFWFKSESTSKAYMAQIQKGAGSSGLAFLANSVGTGASAGNITALVWNGSTHAHLSFDGSIDDGEWHHIAFTTTSSAQVLYFDGQSVDTDTIAFTNAFDSNPVVIGARGGPAEFFDGLIDEFAIWDTVLDANTIAKLGSKPLDLTKYSASNLKLWLRAGDKALPEEDASIARQDFYTDFDGTDDHIIGSSIGISGDATFSIAFWAYWSGSSWVADFPSVVGNSTTSTGEGLSTTFNAGRPALDFWVVRYRADNALDVQRWYHLAFTKTSGNISSTSKIYVNGVEVAGSLESSDQAPNIGNSNIQIGRLTTGSSLHWEGKISNVALYQTALDAQTISQMAKSRFTPMRDNRFSVVDFDGSNQFIDISSSLTPSALTFTMWVATVTDSSYRTFIQCGDLLISKSNGNQVHVNKSGVGGQNSTTSFVANEWTHIAVTADSSGTKVYRNGVLDLDGSAISFTAGDILIGKFTGGQFASGSISSVAYYSSVKSAEEIYAIYQQGITYDESLLSGLVGYWRMGDDTSKAFPTIADSSSNSNDGTMTSMASDDIVQQMVAGYDLGAFESSSEELGGEALTTNDTLTGATSSNWGFRSGWDSNSKHSNTTLTYNDTSVFSQGALKITATGATGHLAVVLGDSNFNYNPDNKLLRIKFKYKITQIDGSYIQIGVATGGGQFTAVGNPSSHNSATDIVEFDKIMDWGSNAYFLVWGSNINTTEIHLTDFSVKEVLQSTDLSDTYPAIIDVNEPVLGVNLVDNNTSSGWFDNSDGSTITNITDGVSIADNSGFSDVGYFRDSSILSTDLTVGKTYRVQVDAYHNGVATIELRIRDGASNQLINLTTTNTTYTRYIVAQSATDGSIRTNNHAFGSIAYLTNLSIKEVQGNVGTMTNQDSADLVYSSVLPDQSFLTGVNSAYNFISLDGANDYVNTGNPFQSTFRDSFSVSAWIKPTDGIPPTDNNIFGARGSGGRFYFHIDTNGYLRVYIKSNVDAYAIPNSVTFSNGQEDWYHVCATINNSTNQILLYLDGSVITLDATYNGDISSLTLNTFTTTTNAYVGARNNGGTADRFFNGDIGQIAFWNKALSSTEVSAIYTAGRHTNLLDSYSDNLKLYYAMSGLDAKTGLSDTTTTIYDRSGNSNHGTTVSIASSDLKSSPNAEPNGYAKGDTNRSTTTP